jgi:hypothetical protein
LLHAAPATLRGITDSAIRASAVAGVQSTLAVAGIVGLIAGFTVLALVRPEATAAWVAESEHAAAMAARE